MFCNEYPINQAELALGKPGLLIGRYPGDSYGGGNPWQLLTAVFAELFYLGGEAMFKEVKLRGDFPLDYSEYKEWIELLKLPPGATAKVIKLSIITKLMRTNRAPSETWKCNTMTDQSTDRQTGMRVHGEVTLFTILQVPSHSINLYVIIISIGSCQSPSCCR